MEARAERLRDEVRQRFATQETFDRIESFLLRQQQLTSTEEPPYVQQIEEKTAPIFQKDEELGEVAVTLCRLKNQYLLLHHALQSKLINLMRSMVYGLNNSDYLLFALVSRSLIEHVACLSYLVQQSDRILDGAEGSGPGTPLKAALDQLLGLYGKAFYGNRFFGNEGLGDSMDAVALVKEFISPDIRESAQYYNSLSDFVHPCFASSVLIAAFKLGEGTVGPSLGEKKAAVERILQITGPVISTLEQRLQDFALVGNRIDAHQRKSLQPAATLEGLVVRKVERVEPVEAPQEPPKEPPKEPARPKPSTTGAIFFTKKGKPWLKY